MDPKIEGKVVAITGVNDKGELMAVRLTVASPDAAIELGEAFAEEMGEL